MKRPRLYTLFATATCLAFSAQAGAQTGLRFKSSADSNQLDAQKKSAIRAPRTLQLHYSGNPVKDEPIVGPTLTSTLPLKDDSTGAATRVRNNTLWADWSPFDNSLRTSAGLMWRDAAGSSRGGAPIEAMPNDLDARYRVSTPFFGLGWRSEASRGAPWQLSAEVGTYLTGKGDCRNTVVACSVSAGMGLKPGASNDGIHWNSYFSFGASFQY